MAQCNLITLLLSLGMAIVVAANVPIKMAFSVKKKKNLKKNSVTVNFNTVKCTLDTGNLS